MKTINVNIGGKSYSLSGEDENLVKETAEMVDSQMRDLASGHGELADEKALPLLTALNIAENSIINSKKADNERTYLVGELNNLTDKLKHSLSKYV